LSQVLSLEFEDDDDLLLLDETIGHSKLMIRIRESAKSLSEVQFNLQSLIAYKSLLPNVWLLLFR